MFLLEISSFYLEIDNTKFYLISEESQNEFKKRIHDLVIRFTDRSRFIRASMVFSYTI
jgi:hypothetical protein